MAGNVRGISPMSMRTSTRVGDRTSLTPTRRSFEDRTGDSTAAKSFAFMQAKTSVSAPVGQPQRLVYTAGPGRRDISPLPLASAGNLGFDTSSSRPCSFIAPPGSVCVPPGGSMCAPPGSMSVSIAAPAGPPGFTGCVDPLARTMSPQPQRPDSYKPPLCMDNHLSEAMDMLAARVVGAVRSELQGCVRQEMQSNFSTTFRCAELMERSLLQLQSLVSKLETATLVDEIRGCHQELVNEMRGNRGIAHLAPLEPAPDNREFSYMEMMAPPEEPKKDVHEGLSSIRWDDARGVWDALAPARLKFVKRKYQARANGYASVEEPTAEFEDEQYWHHFINEVESVHSASHENRQRMIRVNLVLPGPGADEHGGLIDERHHKWAQELKHHRLALIKMHFVRRGIAVDHLEVTIEDGPETSVWLDLADILPAGLSRRGGGASISGPTGQLAGSSYGNLVTPPVFH